MQHIDIQTRVFHQNVRAQFSDHLSVHKPQHNPGMIRSPLHNIVTQPNGSHNYGKRELSEAEQRYLGNPTTSCYAKPLADVYTSQKPVPNASHHDLRRAASFHSVITPRRPRRRAVVVGINYAKAADVDLRGACNDAGAVACALVTVCDFLPSEIILLIDVYPSQAYCATLCTPATNVSPSLDEQELQRPGDLVLYKDRQPTRRNILLALNWLRSDTQPGDVLLFYFAGHGIQLDDMSGWEGEGYDEAILPMDFQGEEVNAITAVMIRNLLLDVGNDVQVTGILDCNGGQTMLDPAGTGTWSFIKGVKQRGVWPFITDATDKVSQATYDPECWTHPGMKKRGARPRFVPALEIASVQDLIDPTLQKSSVQLGIRVKGYLFASAPWGECALEAQLPRLEFPALQPDGQTLLSQVAAPCDDNQRVVYHGVFTWCFLSALTELMRAPNGGKRIPYGILLDHVNAKLKYLAQAGGLPKLDQKAELTFYRSGGAQKRDLFLSSFGGHRRTVSYSVSISCPGSVPCVAPPSLCQYLSTWEAEEQLGTAAQRRRTNDLILMHDRLRGRNAMPYPSSSRAASMDRITQSSLPSAQHFSTGNYPRCDTEGLSLQHQHCASPQLSANASCLSTLSPYGAMRQRHFSQNRFVFPETKTYCPPNTAPFALQSSPQVPANSRCLSYEHLYHPHVNVLSSTTALKQIPTASYFATPLNERYHYTYAPQPPVS